LGFKHNHILEAAAKKSVAEKESVLGTTAYDKMDIPLTDSYAKYGIQNHNQINIYSKLISISSASQSITTTKASCVISD
jgi:hypothetical protein